MNELDYVLDCLKDLRDKVDDCLWQKLMSLFVHGEEVMAIEILLEELTHEKSTLSLEQKEKLTKSAEILGVSAEDFHILHS